MPDWIDNTPGLIVVIGVVAMTLGSFLNVVVHRVPRNISVWSPPSHCPQCRSPLRARDNIPLFGYLLRRGRCFSCSSPIPIRYPLVELLAAACVVVAALTSPDVWTASVRSLFLLAMLAISVIDFEHQIIPDKISLPAIPLGVLLSPFMGTARLDAIVGAAIGFGGLWLVGAFYRKTRGVDGLGGGDLKLAAAIGAFLGWNGLAMTMILGSLVGAIVGMTLLASGRASRTTRLPYGTFLAPAAGLVVFFGEAVWSWYTSV